ncbi:3_t:CDS:2 [Ambispora leptoticha]|uniref:3_t:CDS:1 n=1 Tax=Ambispora leptoticha TaxID=144679 RepID=A0A9N9BSC2_9GLOM|nr:3_t:CDS:2 [Ambispora leptoticha]
MMVKYNNLEYHNLRPPYPLPHTNVKDIFEKIRLKSQNRQPLKPANNFFIYRNAMVMQNKRQPEKIDMPKLSTLASKFWKEEQPEVKKYYKQLSNTIYQSISPTGATFNGYSQMQSYEDIHLYGTRDIFSSMEHQNSFQFLDQTNNTNETLISSNLDALIVSNSFSSKNNYFCNCGCPSCSNRIEYLENYVNELQENSEYNIQYNK